MAARPESHAMNKVMKHLPDEPDIRKMDDFFFGVGFLSPALLELVNGTTSIRTMPMMEVVIHQDRMSWLTWRITTHQTPTPASQASQNKNAQFLQTFWHAV